MPIKKLFENLNINEYQIHEDETLSSQILEAFEEYLEDELLTERETDIIENEAEEIKENEEIENTPLIDYIINGDTTELIYETGMVKVPTEIFHRSFGTLMSGYKAGLELQEIYYNNKKGEN